MTLNRIRIAGLLSIALLLASGVFADRLAAQEADVHSGAFYTCGSDRARQTDYDEVLQKTRQQNPALFERMVSIAKGNEGPSLSGDETFFVTDYATGTMKSMEATLVHEGEDALIWLADDYVNSVSPQIIAGLVQGLEDNVKEGPATLDPNKGIIANDIEIFGAPVQDRWSNGAVKLHILLLNISSPIDGGSIEGYFSPYDQTSRPGSNKRNLLYVDLKQLLGGDQNDVDDVLGTIAHEFQHLINHSRYNGQSDKTHWIYNEGLSEVASIRNGYWERDGGDYLKSPNRFSYFDAPSGSGNADTILRGYERSMLWLHYLSERFGDEFLYNLVAATGLNLEPVRTAMQQSGKGSDVETVLGEFWVANYVQGTSAFQGDNQFRYAFPVSSRPSATFNKGGAPEEAQTESASILPHAAFYPRYASNNPSASGLKIRFVSGAGSYKVHAVLYRTNGSIEVQPVSLDEDHIFGGFTSIIFTLVNVGTSEQNVEWVAERADISGVQDYTTRNGVLAFTEIAPNPVRGEARFSFRAANSGPVRLDLFDMRGGKVREMTQGQGYGTGDQTVTLDLSDLPAGVYTARLQDQSGAMAIRQVVVVK